MKLARIALVVPNLERGGGVSTVADFFYETISNDERLDVDLISLSTSAHDKASVRLLAPRTLKAGVQVTHGEWNGRPYIHVGSACAEIEVTRYLPRKKLSLILDSYDIVQVVAGSPAWAYVTRGVTPPVALQVATLARVERERRQSLERGIFGAWRRMMTHLTSRIELRALDCAEIVFVENDWMYEFVSKRIGVERVVYAPPGVDTLEFSPRRGGGKHFEPFILSVGRFSDPRKNVPLLLRAYAAFSESFDNPPALVLAGKSEPSADDWALASVLGLRERIQFLHGLPQDQLAELYRNATMFVSSSDEEGFGMAIVEAMASGIPVVSTRSGGPQTILTDGLDGYLVNVGDVDGLANAMKQLARDPILAEAMGTAARLTAESRYSLRATGTQFIDRYIELLNCRERS